MIIKNTMTLLFDPVSEIHDMLRFEQENDMAEWAKEECTVCTSYTHVTMLEGTYDKWFHKRADV